MDRKARSLSPITALPERLLSFSTTGNAPISSRDFSHFQRLIHDLSGIYLSDQKVPLLVGRLAKRLRALGLKSFKEYYGYVAGAHDQQEVQTMLDCITTNETHFFRDPEHFEWIAATLTSWVGLARRGLRARRVRAWSAGCSTGEEAYSLAMLLLSVFPPASGWQLEVLGTDLSTRVLSVAQDGVWPIAEADEIPPRYLKSFMLRGHGAEEGSMAAGPELKAITRFERLNLALDPYPSTPFDLLLCRNVLIYFSRECKQRVIRRLLACLSPSGLFCVGRAESLHGIEAPLYRHMAGAYTAANGPSEGGQD